MGTEIQIGSALQGSLKTATCQIVLRDADGNVKQTETVTYERPTGLRGFWLDVKTAYRKARDEHS